MNDKARTGSEDDSDSFLNRLLSPFDISEFRSDYITRKSLYVPNGPEKIEKVLGFVPSREWVLEILAADERGAKQLQMGVFLGDNPNTTDEALSGAPEIRIWGLQHQVLRTIYQYGVSNALTNIAGMDKYSPELARACERLLRDLGAPGEMALQWFYTAGAGMPSSGKSQHSDFGDTFVLQLEGVRRFRLAKTALSRRPGYPRYLTTDGKIRKREFHTGWRPDGEEVELENDYLDPENFYTVDLTPGDMIYFPAGCLHQTSYPDGGPSMSVGFAVQYKSVYQFLSSIFTDAFSESRASALPCMDHGEIDSKAILECLADAVQFFEGVRDDNDALNGHYERFRSRVLNGYFERFGSGGGLVSKTDGEISAADLSQDSVFNVNPRVIVTGHLSSAGVWTLYAGDELELELEPSKHAEAVARLRKVDGFTGHEFQQWCLEGTQWDDIAPVLADLVNCGLIETS